MKFKEISDGTLVNLEYIAFLQQLGQLCQVIFSGFPVPLVIKYTDYRALREAVLRNGGDLPDNLPASAETPQSFPTGASKMPVWIKPAKEHYLWRDANRTDHFLAF